MSRGSGSVSISLATSDPIQENYSAISQEKHQLKF